MENSYNGTISISENSLKRFAHDKEVVGISQQDFVPKPPQYGGTNKELDDYMETCVGESFKVHDSLDYPHGRIVFGTITRVQRGTTPYQSGVVYWMATFSDGYKAEYATDLGPFFDEHYAEL